MVCVKSNTDDTRMAYIDSELARRRSAEAHAHTHTQVSTQPQAHNTTASSSSNGRGTTHPQHRKEAEALRQPATLGKLQEIDLGAEVRDRNVLQTERARRRLIGEEVADEEEERKPVKVRLGPDGKPWRGRKRRASEDVRRDRLVEDVLRENRRLCPFLAPFLSFSYFLHSFPFPIRNPSSIYLSHPTQLTPHSPNSRALLPTRLTPFPRALHHQPLGPRPRPSSRRPHSRILQERFPGRRLLAAAAAEKEGSRGTK